MSTFISNVFVKRKSPAAKFTMFKTSELVGEEVFTE